MGNRIEILNEKLYWTGRSFGTGLEVVIQRSNLDGTDVETILEGDFLAGGDIQDPRYIEIEESLKMIYWPDGRGIRRADLGGTAEEILFEELGGIILGLDIDGDNGRIYFILLRSGVNKIGSCGIEGQDLSKRSRRISVRV